MDTTTTLPISEARKKIFKITKDIQKPSRYYTLTERGRPRAVILSAQEFESWQETLEVMRDFPDLEKDIKEAKQAVKSGEYKNWTTLEELLRREGFSYGIPVKNQAKSRKRAKKTA